MHSLELLKLYDACHGRIWNDVSCTWDIVLILDCQEIVWHKVFKNGPNKICGRQPLKNLKGYGLFKQGSPKYIFFAALQTA